MEVSVKEDHSAGRQHRIRVMIVDDHPIVRQGLRAIVDAQRDMEVVAETGQADEILPLYASTRPDVVVMDLRLDHGSGVDAIAALRSEFVTNRIVVLSNYSSEEHVFRAVAAGARSRKSRKKTFPAFIRPGATSSCK